MQKLFFVVISLLVMLASTRAFLRSGMATRAYATSRALNMGLHDHSLETLSGETKKLSDYKGKVVLMENVATL
jgi:hypothetical protein